MSMRSQSRAGPGLAAALLLLALASPGRGLSMRHSAAQARLAGAEPGGSYALGKEPVALSIVNTGREPVDVALMLEETSPGALRDGFEPIPKAAWLALESPGLRLAPGAERSIPARVAVPKKPGALGQYQAELVSESSGADGARLRLTSSVLVALADEDDDAVAKAREKARRRDGVEVVPAARERRFEAPLGRAFTLEGAVKLANVGSEAAEIVATVTAPEDVPKGLEATPNPRFARLEKRVERIAAGKIEELALDFFAPDEPRYRGRTWAFDVEVEAIEAREPRVDRVRIYVKTSGGERKR